MGRIHVSCIVNQKRMRMKRIVTLCLILFIPILIPVSCNDRELKRTYFENGMIESEYEVRNSVRDGITKSYSKSGVLRYQGNYKNGLSHGWHEWFYPDGLIHYKTLYVILDGRPLWSRKLSYNRQGDLVSDFRFAQRKISVKIRNKGPYRVYDTLSFKLKIENAKHSYSEATLGDFDQNLNPRSYPDTPRYFEGNDSHEIYMKIQPTKAKLDTFTWLVRDFDFIYRTDSTGTSIGEEAYVGFPIEVLPR